MNLRTLLRASPASWTAQTSLQSIPSPVFAGAGLELLVKREDQLDIEVSGNKLYKLHAHLLEASRRGAGRLVSFGGFHSNHLHALAAVGSELGIPTVGIVRGHCPAELNATLLDCRERGMRLIFCNRADYGRKHDVRWCREFLAAHGVNAESSWIIPEGGGDARGARGCGVIMEHLRSLVDLTRATVCVACGTGATLAGLISASRPGERVAGFPVLKFADGGHSYRRCVENLLDHSKASGDWQLVGDYHCGGYAKLPAYLRSFMATFENDTGVPLDPVYTGKAMLGMTQLAERGFWPHGHRVILVHTGGLQGRRGHGLVNVVKTGEECAA